MSSLDRINDDGSISVSDTTSELIESAGGMSVNDKMNSDSRYIYSTGCPVIDIPLGGGVRSGRIMELFGLESNGKTSLALEYTKAFCKHWINEGNDNYSVLWVESESSLDRLRVINMGCVADKFIFEEAETVQQAHRYMTEKLLACVNKKHKLFIVWDTLASASTEAELSAAEDVSDESNGYKDGMMDKPRYIHKMLRTITNLLGKTDSALVLVNQVHIKPTKFGSTLETPGGLGVKFHSSVRTHISKIEDHVESNGRHLGIVSSLTHIKNKTTSPKQDSIVYISNEYGVLFLETTVRFLKKNGLLTVKGGGYCSLVMPDKIATVSEDGKIVCGAMVEISFQNSSRIAELKASHYPHIEEWLNYLVYKHYSNSTILTKVRNIDKLWEYEVMFFGKKLTEITDHEQKLAAYARRLLLEEDEKDGKKLEDLDRKSTKKEKPKKSSKAAK